MIFEIEYNLYSTAFIITYFSGLIKDLKLIIVLKFYQKKKTLIKSTDDYEKPYVSFVCSRPFIVVLFFTLKKVDQNILFELMAIESFFFI